MMNDVKALCEVDDAGLVRFVGAYHAPENGQVRSLQRMKYGPAHMCLSGAFCCECFVCCEGRHCLQIALVLEYMDGGSLGDVLEKARACLPLASFSSQLPYAYIHGTKDEQGGAHSAIWHAEMLSPRRRRACRRTSCLR